MFGRSSDYALSALKAHLHHSDLIDSPRAKLDAVMVEDYDHFCELVGSHGVPLARHPDTYVERPEPLRVVKRTGVVVALLAFTATLHPGVLIDVFLGWLF